jgi:TolA-binding protein
MSKAWMTMAAALCGCLVTAAALPRASAAEPAAAFEQLLQRVVQAPAAVSEQEVLGLLAAGREAGRPAAANLAVKAWLSQQRSPSAAVLLAAADAAALAGDLKTAAARLKLAIAAAPADEARSRAAARLYAILIDDLGRVDDAYSFMARNHTTLRQSPEARKFDAWLVETALARRDAPVAAATLAAVMAERQPLELERIQWWHRLDAVMGELARAQPGQFPAAAAAKQLAGLVRESPPRAARYGFIAAWLEYRATAAGKDPAALAAAFAPVVAAATAYVDAVPAAATLADVQNIFVCGTNSHELWNTHSAAIGGWWNASFRKLSDEEKPRAINWSGWWNFQSSPAQWIELAAASPQVFQAAGATRSLPVLSTAPDPAVYAKQATFLAGVASDPAKAANALAATGGTDLLAGMRHLSAAESWHGGFDSTMNVLNQTVWPVWRSFPREPAATDADYSKAMVAWGPEAIVRTPLAIFQPAAAAGYLSAVFGHGGADPADRSQIVPALRSLDWVPWSPEARQAAIKPAHDAFKQWADQVRKQLTAAQAAAKAAADDKAKADAVANWEKAAAQIAPLEEEFKKAFDPAVSNAAEPAAAADPLAAQLAACVRAVRAKDVAAYVAAARQAYALVRDYPEKKTPFGAAALQWLVTNHHPDGFDLTAWQSEVIADQMQIWAPGKPTAFFLAVDTALASGRPNGNYWDVPKARRGQALAINAAIGKGILALLEKGQFNGGFFERFRVSRRGNGWQDQEAGKEVLAKLIDTKAFLVHKQRVGVTASATADYQWLVRSEFQSLAGQFPPETFFDDMFVEEFKDQAADQAGDQAWLDATFLNYSRDEKKKAATLAAEKFAGYSSLAAAPGSPLGFDQPALLLVAGDRPPVAGRSPTWSRDDFWRWHGHAMTAPAPWPGKVVETALAGWGKTRFDGYAMGNWTISGDPAVMDAPAAREAFFTALAAYSEKVRAYPSRAGYPGLAAVHRLEPKALAPAELDVLLGVFRTPPPTWNAGGYFEQAGLLVARALVAAGRDQDLLAIAPELWRIGRDTRNNAYFAELAGVLAGVKRAGRVDVAGSLASAGIEMLGTELPEQVRGQLTTLRSEALLAAGGTNPVPRSDPRWPIYESQIAFAAGKPQSAWDSYLSASPVALQMHRGLDPSFTTWLIRENTATGNHDRARELGQAMLAWSDSTPGALDAESQAALLVAYADIALARREYPQARALYERIAAAREYDGTAGKRDAELRVAEVDRLSRQFERAREILEKLLRRPDRTLQAEAAYQLALLKVDQEEIEEAAGFLEQVFTRVPNHVGGRILEGRLNLLRRKYDVAAKVKLGVLGDRKFLIPGKPLEVDLEDKNLAVVGKATQIEIRAWTGSGDEERFNLLPFGDSKTRFSGQLPTQLGPAIKGDHVLQVLGGDTVRYAFAESFAGAREAAGEPAALTVVSDGDMFASSGAILSKEEQESRALERMIRDRLRLDEGLERRMALSAARSDDQIKPGNRINVRVVDADRSVSAEPDTVTVRAVTTSGDRLLVTLTETGPATGVFEGAIPTGASQATAYASDSTDGNDPNNAIGPAGDVPWVGLADSVRPKSFSVDLNDNVALGTMTVTAAVPGRKLRDVYVQTSLNGRDFVTRGQWRADGQASFKPWDAAPRMELVRIAGDPGYDTPAKFADYLERGRLAGGSPLVAETLPTLAAGPFDYNLGGRHDRLGLQVWYVGHWTAAFELNKPETRTFTLDPKGKTGNIRYLFVIDGQPSEQKDKPLAITRLFAKGTHRIDVYAAAHRGAGLHFEVLLDAPEPPFTAGIPPAFFSPGEHPALADAFAVAPAAITAEGDRLSIAFAKGTRARVVRLLLANFETDAPAINAITLADAAGGRVLPTERSFLELAKNDVLEIIPGDRITVGYEDPSSITPERRTQERFLTATFTNAEVSAAFVKFDEVNGDRRSEYIPMRRFKPGDTVKLFVNDPDMDVSDEPDRVTLTVRGGRGKPVSVDALETEGHSGVFVGTVFPVSGEPARPSEITVTEGDDLRIAYLDGENTDPGIPWERTALLEQSGSEEPALRVYDVASRPLDEQERAALEQPSEPVRRVEERVPISREIVAVRPQTAADAGRPARALVDGPVIVEVIHPALAQSPSSEATIYVQTESGRRQLGREVAAGEFPLDAPGTIRLERTPGDLGKIEPPPAASRVVVQGDRYALPALDEGRFTFLVRTALGALPERSLATEVRPATGPREEPVLQIRGDDAIHVGYRYGTPTGEERWATQRIELFSEPLFDVMDQRYQERLTGTHVGDALHLRLIHPALDTGDEKDVVTVGLTTSAGTALELPLFETFAHSGVFKGSIGLSYRDGAAAPAADAADPAEPAAAAGRTLPVVYGDTVLVTYQPPAGPPLERKVTIFKGGDASLVPFTKQFKDPEIAVQTQFTVAESWFELAKRHRELGQESLARREIAQGKKLLEEAIRDYPNSEARAQADYLLANLAFEFSKDAANEEVARQHAMDAVTRFSDIVASFPDSEYAPKSQYKKALVLEKLGRIDQACEEYVKLSYRYPDNELVAETIARLGQYFLAKGKEFDDDAAAQTDPVEREKVVIQGREMFVTAAQVFSRLGERFPQHALAGKTKMLSAQCYLRAADFPRALEGFEAIFKSPGADKDLAAEAMYWAGDVCLQKADFKNAYRSFKKLTWDYPESKWAKFARGRLTEDALVKAEADMEREGR